MEQNHANISLPVHSTRKNEIILYQPDEKVDFFVRSSLQPKEGVFFNGQIFDFLEMEVTTGSELLSQL